MITIAGCICLLLASPTIGLAVDIDNPPISRAGPDVVLHWPQNSVVLHGDGSTDDVGIVNYEWIYNPQSTQEFSLDMMGVRTPHLQLQLFDIGDYLFTLKVTDTIGQISTSKVYVALKPTKRGRSPPKTDQILRFIVMGDWGGLPDYPYTTPIEIGVSKEMGIIGDHLDSAFTLALGDNFYFDGIKSVEDLRFQETFEQVYTAESLQRDWYLVAGNHDHRGNVSAQIMYTQHSKRWNFPDYYYKLQFTIPGTSSNIDILMLDTVVMCGNSLDDRLGLQPMGPMSVSEAEKQWQWVEENINSSRADYLIVAGHYPVYSIAEHGPTKCLVDRLQPLLHKHKATAYFSGHDHNLQHLEYTAFNHTVNYFVSGSANFVDPSMHNMHMVPKDSLKFHWADFFSHGGLSYVEATPNNMTFTFVEANGQVLYEKVMQPRNL